MHSCALDELLSDMTAAGLDKVKHNAADGQSTTLRLGMVCLLGNPVK